MLLKVALCTGSMRQTYSSSGSTSAGENTTEMFVAATVARAILGVISQMLLQSHAVAALCFGLVAQRIL